MTNRSKPEKKLQERDPESGRIFINSVDEIPIFSSDEEEVEFWETHEATMNMFEPRGMSLEEALRQANAREHPAER
jgi:hypothetical protein